MKANQNLNQERQGKPGMPGQEGQQEQQQQGGYERQLEEVSTDEGLQQERLGNQPERTERTERTEQQPERGF